jgi:hypothetical protein
VTHRRLWKNSNAVTRLAPRHKQTRGPSHHGFRPHPSFFTAQMSYSKPTSSGRDALNALRKRGRYWVELGTFLHNLKINGDGGHNLEGYKKERQKIDEKTVEIYNQLSDEQKSCLTCDDTRTFSGITRSHGVHRFG